MTCTQLYNVANFCFTQSFCCNVPGAMYSNFTPIPSCLHSLSKASFSPALLHWMHLISIPSVTLNLLEAPPSYPSVKTFLLKDNSKHPSIISNQYFLSPRLAVKGKLISVFSLSLLGFNYNTAIFCFSTSTIFTSFECNSQLESHSLACSSCNNL